MFSLINQRLLSDQICVFYQEGIDQDGTGSVSKYFNADGTFNSKEIIRRLFPEHDTASQAYDALQTFTYDNYIKCYTELLPIFKHSKNVIENLCESNANTIECLWMGRNAKIYMDLYNTSRVNHETKVIEHILVLTSLLENALANIYYTKTRGKHAPHLLRDLLHTKEVRQIFGTELIILLKIVMGSPNSINLRNVVWHGFPKPDEIPVYYESVLLIMIHSLGLQLGSLNFDINERPMVMSFSQSLDKINNELKVQLPDINNIEAEIMELKNEFDVDYKTYWRQLCIYYKSQRYIEFLILILPQIEVLLRLHYGQINEFDISAKLDEYYITMDTIFEMDVMVTKQDDNSCQRPNKLLDFSKYPLYEGCFHLMYDMFLSPSGCRLRDKVSHGEASLAALNSLELSSAVFHIYLNLLKPLKWHTLNSYQSKLHLNCINQHQLKELYDNLQDFNGDVLDNSCVVPEISLVSLTSKVLIFRRPKKEAEIMLLINKITENIKQTLENYKQSIELKSALMFQRELHSKRRKTLEKLQAALPEIFNTLMSMWCSVYKIFCLLQADYCLVLQEETKCVKTIRFLKHLLTISDNLVKYSHCDSNEWIKSLELSRKYYEFYNKLFLFKDL